MNLQCHLYRLEALLMAEPSRGDRHLLERLLAEDFREFTSSGLVCNKQQVIEALGTEVFIARSMTEPVFSQLGDDIAQLTYTCTSPSNTSLRSSLWRRTAEKWQLFFHQGTRINAMDT